MTTVSFSLIAATAPWLRIQPRNPHADNFRFKRVAHDCAQHALLYALPHALLLSTITSFLGQHDRMQIFSILNSES